jgi:hypothetical protein
MHQATGLNFAGCIIGKLFGDGNITIKILDKNFEISIQLEKRKSSLSITSARLILESSGSLPWKQFPHLSFSERL